MKILSFSTVYPTPNDPRRGVFVRSRLQAMAGGADVKVLAPVLALDYSRRAWKTNAPLRTEDGNIETHHPRWTYLPGSGAVTAIALFAQMAIPVLRLRREFPFDLIDAHYGYPEGIAAAMLAKLTGAPFSVTLRGSELLHSRYLARRILMQWSLRRAACVIAVSEELRRHAIRLGADPARVHTIPNGVDSTSFHRRDRHQARRQLGLQETAGVILTAGHLIELKGHHRAVAALRCLHDQGLRAQLVIAGGPPGAGVRSAERLIQTAIADFGLEQSVRLTGAIPEDQLALWMSAADVFCLASSREGWPNVAAEALACGTPVVATRVGAIPEILTSEKLGYVVEPGDVGALAAGLARALRTDWDREAIAAQAGRRSWGHVAREVLDRLRLALSENAIVDARISNAGTEC